MESRTALDFVAAIRARDRRAVARAITLLESTLAADNAIGREILEALVSETGDAIRVGITGPPGVGKSTFIETLGLHLLSEGRRVAVLAIDPTSPLTGGSILGDKTRMELLAHAEGAFIRPSPSRGSLGGVGHRTREAMLLCEGAGYDVILIETVGVGQSEVTVRSMVDFFMVLLQPGAGDELQGIKRGLLELADALVVTKADGDQKALAERTQAEHRQALQLLRPPYLEWKPPVLAVSSRVGEGIPEAWESVLAHRAALTATGALAARRQRQARDWMWSQVQEGLERAFRADPAVAQAIPALEQDVEASRTTPAAGARRLLEAFRKPV